MIVAKIASTIVMVCISAFALYNFFITLDSHAAYAELDDHEKYLMSRLALRTFAIFAGSVVVILTIWLY